MADMVNLADIWASATDEVADEIGSAQQRAYLRLTRLFAIVEDTALISVPDAFTRDIIETRLRPAITDALTRGLGRPVQVAVTVRPPEDGPAAPSSATPGGPGSSMASHVDPDALFDAPRSADLRAHDPRPTDLRPTDARSSDIGWL